MPGKPLKPRLSQDAAIVLGLAGTAVVFASSRDDGAERWLRVMRLYGQVGHALQALGVPEGPLETARTSPRSLTDADDDGLPSAPRIERRATELAAQRGSPVVTTVDTLFAVLEAYGAAFERALYRRGTTVDELLETLARHRERASGIQQSMGSAPHASRLGGG